MKRWGRKILFWSLVALFLVVAPSVIMFAKGYRFDFGRGVFVHSGTITIKTNPRDIELTINGVAENSKQLDRVNNAFNISGLMPKEYRLSVGAAGFQTWDKKVDVHSGMASEFWSILLVRNDYEKENYNANGAKKFYISPKSGSMIHVVENPDDYGISAKILSIRDRSVVAEFDFPGWQLAPDERRENIEWSPEEDFLSIPLKKGAPINGAAYKDSYADEYAYFIADPKAKTSFNLNEFLEKTQISNVRWDPKDKNFLFFQEGEYFYRANIADKNNITLISDSVAAFDLSENAVYFSKNPNKLVYKSSLDGKGEKNQLTFAYPESSNATVKKMIVYDELRIAFLEENGDLFIYNRGEFSTYAKKLSAGIEGMHFSNDGKKLLYWTDSTISVYFLRQWNVQPFRNENETQDITRYSEKLNNVQWFKDYEHIIFSIGSQTKIIELDPRDHRNSMDLAKSNTDNPFVIYNSYLEKLFFIDNLDSEGNIHSFNFPEPVSFLGIL